jgi:hypothetical protein
MSKQKHRIVMRCFLVGRVGIEPTTIGLKDRCSTTELPARTCEHYIQVSDQRKRQRYRMRSSSSRTKTWPFSTSTGSRAMFCGSSPVVNPSW